jgi:hypothetical protein
MKQDPRTIIDTSQDHTFYPPADKKVIRRTLDDKFSLVWKADKPDHRDYKYQVTQKTNPNIVDLRSYCSPIEHQGSLGSCTGQSIAGAIEFDRYLSAFARCNWVLRPILRCSASA